MKSLIQLAIPLIGLGALTGVSGCELSNCDATDGGTCVEGKSLKRFVGTPSASSTPFSGGDIGIEGVYGNLTTINGDAAQVTGTFTPFSYRAFDKQQEATAELALLNKQVSAVVEGVFIQSTRASGSTNGLGAEIVAQIPPEFAGTLLVHNLGNGPVNPGDLNVGYVAGAHMLRLSNDNLGNCVLRGGPNVVSTLVTCHGPIEISGVRDEVNVAATGLLNTVKISIDAIASGSPGGQIDNEDGNVILYLPSVGDYSVQAQAGGTGVVAIAGLPTGCQTATNGEQAKSITCNKGGANYRITTRSGSVHLNFN